MASASGPAVPVPSRQSERVASISCYFEGSFRGQSAVLRNDRSQATARDGTPLIAVRILVGQGEYETVESITLRETDLGEVVPLGEYVRIPGSISVSRRGDRVFVSKWGNAVLWPGAGEAGARHAKSNGKTELVAVG